MFKKPWFWLSALGLIGLYIYVNRRAEGDGLTITQYLFGGGTSPKMAAPGSGVNFP